MKTWNPPAVHRDYGQMWQTIKARTNLPGAIDESQARTVHVKWRSMGKRAEKGRL